jgi:hypothetical protein
MPYANVVTNGCSITKAAHILGRPLFFSTTHLDASDSSPVEEGATLHTAQSMIPCLRTHAMHTSNLSSSLVFRNVSYLSSRKRNIYQPVPMLPVSTVRR